MKLVKCHISSFGKLQNFTYDFSQGLNTIKEDNGWGKSTLATFIKAMFYGLNDSKRNVAENERIKFRPWGSSDKFGGYVQFVWGDKEYKIERFFGVKESDDTVALFDVATGKPFHNTENLGKRIFEIDEEGFLSTTYFSQKDFQAKSNTSLTAKFNAVCEVQDTDAFDKAVNKLEEKAKTFKYRGDKGIIADCKREIYFINDEMERANKAAQTVILLKNDLENLQAEVNNLQTQTKILTEKVGAAGRAEAAKVNRNRYEKLLAEKQSLAEDEKMAKSILGENIPDEYELKRYKEKLQSISTLNVKIDTIKKDVDAFSGYENQNRDDKKLKITSITAFSASALFILLAIILLVSIGVSSVFGWAAMCVGVALLVLAVILHFNFSKKKTSDNPYAKLLKDKEIELEQVKLQMQEDQKEVDGFISKFNLGADYDSTTALEYVEKIVRVYKDVSGKISVIDKELKELEKNKDEFIALSMKAEDLSALNYELSRVQNEYSKKTIELANKRSSISAHEDLASKYTDFESKKAELNEKIAHCEEEYDVLTKTAKFLKQADENLKIKYRAPLQNSLSKYYAYVTESDKELNIDIDLKVTVGESSGQKVTDFYSKGYQNLFELCKRFALTDVLFTGEKPFIILDDPFYNLDDKKLLAALELLNKLSADYQILYLVCHESRVLK